MDFPWGFKILNVSFLHMLYAASRGELCAMQLWVKCRHWNPTNITSLEHQTLTLKIKFIADTKYKNLPKIAVFSSFVHDSFSLVFLIFRFVTVGLYATI